MDNNEINEQIVRLQGWIHMGWPAMPAWQRPTGHGMEGLEIMPDYAGQICTAWQLVDEIMESCFGVLIGTSHEGTFCQILQEDQPEIIEYADTAPLAICEAYMAWKGKKK